MKYRTKKDRLIAIFEAYLVKFKQSGATMDEVTNWALEHKLYPVPKRGDAADICEAWERKLKEVTA
jgi:hypothetical protein